MASQIREEALDGGDRGGWGNLTACSICIWGRRRRAGEALPETLATGWGCERVVESGSGESSRREGRRGPWGARGHAARRWRSPEAAGVGGGGGDLMGERERRRARACIVVFESFLCCRSVS